MEATVPWPEKLRSNQNRVSSRVIMELVNGKEYANQLQAHLLLKPYGDHEGLVLAEELAQKILRSFTDSLAELSSPSSSEMSQIAAADQDSGDSNRPEVKYRRGCYKRKRAAESRVIVTATKEDGYAWRKYGQKDILNSKYPRCYFRCTHKYDQGCQATKQVQKMDQINIVYQTTYFGQHTCRDTTRAPQIILDSDSMELNNLISFQQAKAPNNNNNNNMIITSSSKHESKEETQSDVTDNKSSNNSTLWQNIIPPVMDTSPRMEIYHDQEVVSSVYNNASTSLHGLDIKTLSSFADFNNHDFPF